MGLCGAFDYNNLKPARLLHYLGKDLSIAQGPDAGCEVSISINRHNLLKD